VDSCFALLGARQHCVAKICNVSPTANAHKLQNDPSSLYQVPYFELTCAPKHAWPHHVFRSARTQSGKIGVSKSKRINVAGQGQPRHSHIVYTRLTITALTQLRRYYGHFFSSSETPIHFLITKPH